MTSLELWPPREDDGALVPLSEVRNALIEASAGTGKTYQTEGLVVRLVAEEGVSIERILLITFTRAATAELRGRVRGRLSRALRVLAKSEASPTDDEVLLALDALKGARRAEARRRVEVALRNYDRAPISTIHGFCQRVLSEQTLAAGESPEPIVQSEARDLRERLVLDALGSVYANASLELLASLNGQCITLGSLAAVGRVAAVH
jgi:ATP-dependent exoDNAse (exonuclease V) beta subunit